MIKKFSQFGPLQGVVEVKPCFGTVHEADRGKTYLKAIKASRKTIDAVVSWRRYKQLSIHFKNQIQTALKQDVTIRIFTEKPINYKMPKWVNQCNQVYKSPKENRHRRANCGNCNI